MINVARRSESIASWMRFRCIFPADVDRAACRPTVTVTASIYAARSPR